jgi:large subunit ribosomal protein L4
MSPESKSESVAVETKVTGWQSVSAEELAEVKVRPQVLREVILALQANLHQSNANTKRRGEVSGGGKKPWRQKGTGRARVGSSRTPVWRGGGVVFGPLNIKNYQQKLTSVLRRQALAGVLKLKINQGKVAIWNLTAPITKTKEVVKQMPQLIAVSPTLVILPSADYKIAFRNLPNVSTSSVAHVNALEIAGSRQIVFLGDTFEQIKKKVLS